MKIKIIILIKGSNHSCFKLKKIIQSNFNFLVFYFEYINFFKQEIKYKLILNKINSENLKYVINLFNINKLSSVIIFNENT